MNMDLLRDKSWRDVSEIWLAYHKKRNETLSAVIPLEQFKEYYSQSVKYPMVFSNNSIILILRLTFKHLFLVYIAFTT